MKSELDQYRGKIAGAVLKHSVAKGTLKKEKKALEVAKADVTNTTQAQIVLQQVAQVVQRRAHKQIAQVVSRCLTAVFDEKMKFNIRFDRKRGKTEASLNFIKGGKEIDPIDGSAGGVLDVAALALRLACLLLQRPARRRVIIADEPFRNINGIEYQERAGKLIEMLAREMKVQWIIVTDDDWLKIGKVVEV